MSMRGIAALLLIGAACQKNDSGVQTADAALRDDHSVAGTTTAASAGDQASYAAAVETVDPTAIAALNKMASYLRSLKAYEVKAKTTQDDVLSTGQKAQFTGTQDSFTFPDLASAPDDRATRQHRFEDFNFAAAIRSVHFARQFNLLHAVRSVRNWRTRHDPDSFARLHLVVPTTSCRRLTNDP